MRIEKGMVNIDESFGWYIVSEFRDNAISTSKFRRIEMRVDQNTQVFDFRILNIFFATNFKERIKGECRLRNGKSLTMVSED